MKILMLNYEFPPIGGGAGNAHLCLLKEYAGDSNLVIDVLTSAPKPGFVVERFARNVTIYKLGLHKKDLHYWRKTEVLEWLFKACLHYRRLLRTNDYDLAHAFSAFPTGLVCSAAAKKLPYIISLRGSDVPGVNPRLSADYKILAPLFRQIWKRADLIVACSQGLRRRAMKFLPMNDIEVIPNGVDLQKFSPPYSKTENHCPRLLTVARLSATKRLDLLISATGLVCRQYPAAKLTIAGAGKPSPDLQRKRAELGIASQVVFLGALPHEQMPALYRQHDIYVSATAQEGMSNAMLEAMACGLPIVTTRCEGLDELIADNGIIVEQPAANSIASAIKQLIQDQHTRISMSAASRKRAASFTWTSAADRYIRCYQKILAKQQPYSVG